MPHDITLIATISVGFAVAFIFGFLATRLRLPPLVGYLIAGVVVGPFSPGFTADSGMAGQLAEIGVMLLMFGVGLHFSLSDLLAVRSIAVPGAIGQIIIATAIGAGLAHVWGWSLGAGLVLGLSLSVASTVVLLKALEERGAVETPNGRIAIGWLIVEDLAMVLALVLLPALAPALGGHAASAATAASRRSLLATLGITLAEVSAFIALVLIIGPRVLPWLLRQVARTGSRELFTLAVLAIALGIAFGSAKLFGVSYALGAFFAGMVLHESQLSHKAASNVLPLQDAFAVLFFVSVGMLFDPAVLLRAPGHVAAVVLLILVGKSLVALVIVLALGFPLSTALIVSASLAQIGEFSFILAALGRDLGLLSAEGVNLVLAGALISITLNQTAFAFVDRICRWVARHPRLRERLEVSRASRFASLRAELDAARERATRHAADQKTFTPDELVERFPLFAALTPTQREVLVHYFEARTAVPGERLIRRGEEADVVYFIAAGEAEVAVAGERIKLRAGDYFGEMALINDRPRSADVTALDYTKLATLTRRDFQRFLAKFPEIREQITTLATQREDMNRQLEEKPVES